MAENQGHLTFRNARAHIRISDFDSARKRADAEGSS